MFFVNPSLPRAGLGNMLLVWGRAVLFAEINCFPIVAPNWNLIRIGPLLRGEKYKRFYGNLFDNKGYVSRVVYSLSSLQKKCIYYNPDISKLDITKFDSEKKNCNVFVFDEIPSADDLFVHLRENQIIIRQRLFSIIRPSVYKSIVSQPAPEIGIHVRLSDFEKLQPGTQIHQKSLVRTPVNWYVNVLTTIRSIAGYDVPATIFSDGFDMELGELLKLNNVSRAPKASALSDIINLSRSKLIITSARSTFSAWASYLGQCPTIWHPVHFDANILSSKTRMTIFEDKFDPELAPVPDLLVNNIKLMF